jgi:hypothetical protein
MGFVQAGRLWARHLYFYFPFSYIYEADVFQVPGLTQSLKPLPAIFSDHTNDSKNK